MAWAVAQWLVHSAGSPVKATAVGLTFGRVRVKTLSRVFQVNICADLLVLVSVSPSGAQHALR